LPEIEVMAPGHEASLETDEVEQPQEITTSAISRADAEELESALRWLDPVEPVIVVEDAATPVVVGGAAERNTASRESPPRVSDSASSRLAARREFDLESSLPSPASVPAPASLAASGVEAENRPQILVNPPPIYPADALAAGRTGRVVVRAEVAADGQVLEARIQHSSGVATLDRAAVSAVRQWRFTPAPDSQSPPRRIDAPIDFVIRRTAAAPSSADRSAAGR
jgi:TonB family protein